LKNDPDKPGKLMVDPNAKLEEIIVLLQVKQLVGQHIKDGFSLTGIYLF
jgi:hypothetical protein